jgi:hypothetical protein
MGVVRESTETFLLLRSHTAASTTRTSAVRLLMVRGYPGGPILPTRAIEIQDSLGDKEGSHIVLPDLIA